MSESTFLKNDAYILMAPELDDLLRLWLKNLK